MRQIDFYCDFIENLGFIVKDEEISRSGKNKIIYVSNSDFMIDSQLVRSIKVWFDYHSGDIDLIEITKIESTTVSGSQQLSSYSTYLCRMPEFNEIMSSYFRDFKLKNFLNK